MILKPEQESEFDKDDAIREFPPDLQEEFEFWQRIGEESWAWIDQFEKEVVEGKVQDT